MSGSVPHPVDKLRTSRDEARFSSSHASTSSVEPIRIAWTKELERRRQAVDRWRGTATDDRKGDNAAHD